MAGHGADPAHLRADDRDRFLVDHRLKRHFFDLPGLGKLRPTGAAFVVFAEGFLGLFQLLGDLGPLQALIGQQVFEVGAFQHQFIAFAHQFHLFQTAQAAQAHVQDRIDLNLGQLALARFGRDIVGLVVART